MTDRKQSDEPGGSLTRRAVVTGTCVVAGAAIAGYVTFRPSGEGNAGPRTLGSTSEIPIGGGIVFAEVKVVVTQPTAGTFHGFSATCTHRGCTVKEVVDGTINCPCHGSKFDSTDGSVVNGPAPTPLPQRQITVDGTSLKLA